MPLEIKELLVKVAVDESQPGTSTGGSSSSVNMEGNQEFIKSVVEQVLETLKEKQER